jgi:hypothetical protein
MAKVLSTCPGRRETPFFGKILGLVRRNRGRNRVSDGWVRLGLLSIPQLPIPQLPIPQLPINAKLSASSAA